LRVALISDIHGNLAALDAVLRELERERFDELVCLGDVAVGPQGAACLERLEVLGCPAVRGNWDDWFLDGIPELEGVLGEKLGETGAWWAAQLADEDRDRLRSYRPTYQVGSLLCFHGSPRSNEDWVVAETPDDELEKMLGGARDSVLAGGHTHLPLVRRFRDSLLINPGSVGLPFRQGLGPIRIGRWAEYAIVDVDGEDRVTVELRRTGYDVEAYLELARASGMPHADWWVGCWSD
jgi:putative phosphoesterase